MAVRLLGVEMKSLVRKLIALILPFAIRKRLPRNFSRHLHFKGKFQVIHDKSKLLSICSTGYVLENDLYFYGLDNGHERKAMSVWVEFCKKFNPQVVYDIGANTGIYGLVSLALNPQPEVVFFEPLESATKILRKNLEMNKFNAQIYEVALSNYDGEGTFFMNEGMDFLYSITLNEYADLAIQGTHDSTSLYEEKQVKVVTIDSLIKNGSIPKPKLVKIDVETHEPEVLGGFGFPLLEVDAFLIEILNTEAALKLNAMFQGLDFEIYSLDDTKNTSLRIDEFIFNGSSNFFVVKSNLAKELESLK
jgi:FkbM family methyltransferase